MRRAGSDGANSQFNVLLLQDVTFAEVFLQMYFPLIQSYRMAANTVARQIPLGRPKVTISQRLVLPFDLMNMPEPKMPIRNLSKLS